MTREEQFEAFLAENENEAWSLDEATARWTMTGDRVLGMSARIARPIYDRSAIGKTRKPSPKFLTDAVERLKAVLVRFTDEDLDHTRHCVLALVDDPFEQLPWSHARRLVSWARAARRRGGGTANGAPKAIEEYLRSLKIDRPGEPEHDGAVDSTAAPAHPSDMLGYDLDAQPLPTESGPAGAEDASEWSPADTGTLPGLGVGALIPPPESDRNPDPETLASAADLRDLGIKPEPPTSALFADRDPDEETVAEFTVSKLRAFVERAFERMHEEPWGPGYASITIRLNDAGRDDDGNPVLAVAATEEWDTHSDPLRRDPLPTRPLGPPAF